MRNPFKRRHDPDEPRPGGIDGRVVDWERWYPPDTPFKWGQGFNHPFSNVPAINGGKWLNQFLPDSSMLIPVGVDYWSFAAPAAVGSSGHYQVQLNWGGVPGPPAGLPVSAAMDAFGAAMGRRPAPTEALAGGFARS